MRQAEDRECRGTDKKEDNHAPAWHTLTDYISFDKRTNTSKITSEKDRLAKSSASVQGDISDAG